MLSKFKEITVINFCASWNLSLGRFQEAQELIIVIYLNLLNIKVKYGQDSYMMFQNDTSTQIVQNRAEKVNFGSYWKFSQVLLTKKSTCLCTD